jgi:hypothetical protein
MRMWSVLAQVAEQLRELRAGCAAAVLDRHT